MPREQLQGKPGQPGPIHFRLHVGTKHTGQAGFSASRSLSPLCHEGVGLSASKLTVHPKHSDPSGTPTPEPHPERLSSREERIRGRADNKLL